MARQSHDDRRDLVRSALNAGKSPDQHRWVRTMYDDSVVHEGEASGDLQETGYSIDDNNNVTLGDSKPVRQTTSYEPVTVAQFTLDGERSDDGDFVRRPGKVFECGEFPDKDFAFSESEADDAIGAFRPVDNDLEHKKTILAGKLGKLENLRRTGKELFADVLIPKWLDQLVGPDPIGVSLAFDKAKRVVGNALTWNPRISDAQVAAAFTAFTAETEKPPVSESRKETPKPMPKEKNPLKVLAAMFTKAAEEVELEDDKEQAPIDPKDAEIARLKAELEAKKEAPAASFNAESNKARAKAEAERVAAEFVKEGKANPSEVDGMVEAFTEALIDDNPGVTCFTDDNQPKEGRTYKRLLGLYENRKADTHLKEFTAGTQVLTGATNSASSSVVSAERKAELLGYTDLGRQILKESK